jgi:chloramphenicol O-acetyltransferase type A
MTRPEGRREIDLKTWERSALFEFFKGFSEPYHGVCLRVDCTETFDYAKANHLSVFLSLLHRCLVAAHQVENFRTRIIGESVWVYDRIHGGSAVGRPNGTIGFGHYSFRENLHDFVQEASIELERVKARTDIERYPQPDLIRFSTLPWFDFTSISHARDLSHEDSAPRITFGKISETSHRRTMPISIHVHHALADGSHVAEFIEALHALLSAPDKVRQGLSNAMRGNT